MFEMLESRSLLSTVSVVGGALTVNGTDGDDLITVVENSGTVHVEYFDAGNQFQTQDLAGITSIDIVGGGGSDALFFTGNSIGAQMLGDGGAETSHPNGKGHTFVNNGEGHTSHGNGNGYGHNHGLAAGDFITVADTGTGASLIDGEGGDDTVTLLVGNTTGLSTYIAGGDGNDAIYLNTGVGVYNVAASKSYVQAEKGDDTITTYSGYNAIYGGQGKDIVIDLGGSNNVFSAEIISL